MSATIPGEGVGLIERAITMTGAQLRAARALVGCSQPELSTKSRVSVETIQRLERFRGRFIEARRETIERLIGALERLGVELLDSDSPGVRVIPQRKRRK